jgi:hypothetical protein
VGATVGVGSGVGVGAGALSEGTAAKRCVV